jgi:hypothetical protein
MSNPAFARWLASLAITGLLFAPSARGELAAWDQAEVTGFAQKLATATDALHESFIQQPAPDRGSIDGEAYHRLKYRIRMLRGEAHVLVTSLEAGDGRDETEWIYEILTSHARSARYEAHGAFVAKDVGERAAAVRAALNRLGPYYDPDFQTLVPDPNIERGATR